MNQAIEVRQHNAITNARYEYSEMQLDIFLYLLAKLRKDKTDGVYEVSVGEMAKLTGKKYNYQQLLQLLGYELSYLRNFPLYTPLAHIHNHNYISS